MPSMLQESLLAAIQEKNSQKFDELLKGCERNQLIAISNYRYPPHNNTILHEMVAHLNAEQFIDFLNKIDEHIGIVLLFKYLGLIEQVNSHEENCLHIAFRVNEDPKVASWLLNFEYSIGLKLLLQENNLGQIPLHLCRYNFDDVIVFFKNNTELLNTAFQITDNDGNTPCHHFFQHYETQSLIKFFKYLKEHKLLKLITIHNKKGMRLMDLGPTRIFGEVYSLDPSRSEFYYKPSSYAIRNFCEIIEGLLHKLSIFIDDHSFYQSIKRENAFLNFGRSEYTLNSAYSLMKDITAKLKQYCFDQPFLLALAGEADLKRQAAESEVYFFDNLFTIYDYSSTRRLFNSEEIAFGIHSYVEQNLELFKKDLVESIQTHNFETFSTILKQHPSALFFIIDNQNLLNFALNNHCSSLFLEYIWCLEQTYVNCFENKDYCKYLQQTFPNFPYKELISQYNGRQTITYYNFQPLTFEQLKWMESKKLISSLMNSIVGIFKIAPFINSEEFEFVKKIVIEKSKPTQQWFIKTAHVRHRLVNDLKVRDFDWQEKYIEAIDKKDPNLLKTAIRTFPYGIFAAINDQRVLKRIIEKGDTELLSVVLNECPYKDELCNELLEKDYTDDYPLPAIVDYFPLTKNFKEEFKEKIAKGDEYEWFYEQLQTMPWIILSSVVLERTNVLSYLIQKNKAIYFFFVLQHFKKNYPFWFDEITENWPLLAFVIEQERFEILRSIIEVSDNPLHLVTQFEFYYKKLTRETKAWKNIHIAVTLLHGLFDNITTSHTRQDNDTDDKIKIFLQLLIKLETRPKCITEEELPPLPKYLGLVKLGFNSLLKPIYDKNFMAECSGILPQCAALSLEQIRTDYNQNDPILSKLRDMDKNLNAKNVDIENSYRVTQLLNRTASQLEDHRVEIAAQSYQRVFVPHSTKLNQSESKVESKYPLLQFK